MKTTEIKKKEDKFAVIQTGGKQYVVKTGDVLKVEKIKNTKVGEILKFDNILLVADDKNIQIGKPFVDGAIVEAKIEEEGKNKKITVLRYKSKTRYHKKKGHRQPYTKISIASVKS
jgi:large subunit ribosomal protein L21